MKLRLSVLLLLTEPVLLGIGGLVRDEEWQHEVVGGHLGPAALPQPEGGVLVARVEAERSGRRHLK